MGMGIVNICLISGEVIEMAILRKHYTCFNCGERHQRDTSEQVIDAQEQVRCPNCGGYPMNLASVEQVEERGVYVERIGIEG